MTAVADGPRKVSVAWRERMVEMEYAWIAPERTAAPLVVFLHEGLGSVAMWKDFRSGCAKRGISGAGLLAPRLRPVHPRAADEVWAWTSCTSRRTRWSPPFWMRWGCGKRPGGSATAMAHPLRCCSLRGSRSARGAWCCWPRIFLWMSMKSLPIVLVARWTCSDLKCQKAEAALGESPISNHMQYL